MLRVGLRPRLLAAFVATSALTLGFAAIALLSPLKDRLRSDGTSTVLAAVGASKLGFDDVALQKDGSLEPHALYQQLSGLARRTGARAVVFDPALKRVYERTRARSSASEISVSSGDLSTVTDPAATQAQTLALVTQSLRENNVAHAIQGQELLVAQSLHIEGRPFVLLVSKPLAYVKQATRVVQGVFFEAAGVGLLVALLLGIAFSSTLLRRLERLRDSARQLDEIGLDAAAPAHDGSRDEIGELTRSFIAMYERLRHQEDARRAFVATASHELRTPLASLDGMLELLAEDLEAQPADIEDARTRVAHATQQSRRLGHLASDLLDLSRIDADVGLRSEPVELVELARAVAAEFDLRAKERALELQIAPTDSSNWADGDPGSVARIVRILLDNALRVAPPGSTVRLLIDGGKRWSRIEVQDDGPGVPEEECERIFERFQRGHGRSGEGGFGLGLAIGRELAQRMGGSLELADHAQETGAAFQLRLQTSAVAVEV
ncbi:MAG: sensor histidine kinase [Solirubrobacteraceae bacterium]